jgi:hypothetical protein
MEQSAKCRFSLRFGTAAMYHTSEGDRVLKGAEAKLFRYGVLRAVEDLSEMSDDEFGVDSFDRMTFGQRLTGLYRAASALLDVQTPILELTQPIEASVATVYRVIAADATIEAEFGGSDGVTVRMLIVEAMREAGCDEIPDPRCSDPEEWQLCVDCLGDRILFDDDYDSFDDLTDKAPAVKANVDLALGIDPDYFSDILDDPPDSEIPTLIKNLEAIGSE